MKLSHALLATLAAAGSAAAAATAAELLAGTAQCPIPQTAAAAQVTPSTTSAEWLARAAPWLHVAPTPAPKNVCGPCGMG